MATSNTKLYTTYKIYNGEKWDVVYFETSAVQVHETTALKFLRPATHTVNGQKFVDGDGNPRGITLAATDIAMSSSDTTKISQKLSSAVYREATLSTTEERLVLGYGADKIKDSGKALETTLTNSDSKVPTSKAVYTAITNASYSLPVATSSVLGGVKIGSNISVNNGTISLTGGNVVSALGYTPLNPVIVGVAGGVASLGSDGKVPSAQLPSYVDDVLEYEYDDSFPSTGETGKIYVDKHNNKTYRWGGTQYVEISPSLALGETSSTAYAGDKGKANATAIASLNTTVSALDTKVKSMDTVLTAAGGSIATLETNLNTATSNITKLTNGTTAAGKATQLATARKFTIGDTGKDFNGTAAVSWTLAEIDSHVRRIFQGNAEPTTGMRTGDIFLHYSTT